MHNLPLISDIDVSNIMAPLVKRPKGPPLWQFGLLGGAGMVAGLYILNSYWKEKTLEFEKADKLAAEKKERKDNQ